MSDTRQAVYDAVRSRICNGDIGEAVAGVMRDANFGHYVEQAMHGIVEAACDVAGEHRRPSVLYRPTVRADGNQWCALYGHNLAEGVCGFGDTPAKAMENFDSNWLSQKPHGDGVKS